MHTLRGMRRLIIWIIRLILFERDTSVSTLTGWSGDHDIFTARLSGGDLHLAANILVPQHGYEDLSQASLPSTSATGCRYESNQDQKS